MIQQYIEQQRQKKDILLMTHIVMGYPNFDACLKLVDEMVPAGVDLMELQIPFSEPIADGPVILKANSEALASGVTLEQCFEFAETVATRFDIPFLFMSYYNLLFKYGTARFVERMARIPLRGAIVPDLPPEEAGEYLAAMDSSELSPIFIYSPNTTEARMDYIAKHSNGFIYCVARKGVTGSKTSFSGELESYLASCSQHAGIPLAVGFGVKEKADVDFLKGKVDVAVIGSESLNRLREGGVPAVGNFLRGLRD